MRSTYGSSFRKARGLSPSLSFFPHFLSFSCLPHVTCPHSGTGKQEIQVELQPLSLSVKLSWQGSPFLSGTLRRRIKSGEAVWCLEGEDDKGEFGLLHIMLPKDELHYWRSLLEGGEERSHLELLKEAVEADERPISYDDMDEGAR